ncbi:tetratricopeptide repeat protein [Rubrolithibacter danxiaensis]|uniref:type IX secretion system periplasmic lipoprotein PorW/SprE n=1 Tax=Rubrolithibacter danxiaensis TaxID=3390805 RepID=UPI003BF79186
MQNLTARYNIIYNSRILLEQSEENIKEAYFDDYSQILSVYKEPSLNSAKSEYTILDSVINKANVIVNEKNLSNYVDDAYFLIATANYWKANFFNATEFLTYIYKTYPKELQLKQASLALKARALMLLNNYEEAKTALDTAAKYIRTDKKTSAEVYAATAQYFIETQNYPAAAENLKKALKIIKNKQEKNRWTFILAQLQERNGQTKEAYENYRAVTKSNAPFEMAFNANLNRIQIEDELGGKDVTRTDRLKSLIRDDKNKEFIDQIYYRIASIYENKGEVKDAVENYNKAISSSSKNSNQKGLAYLKLADLNFRLANYQEAKAYYDSTLITLPDSYPDYQFINRKRDNLEYLAERLKTISLETELQNVARLPETERADRIGAMVREQTQKVLGENLQTTEKDDTFKEGKFYFNNSIALKQGFIDFKKRWGNRKLEDNWRRSTKSAAEVTAMALDNPDTVNASDSAPDVTLGSIKDLLDQVPLTGTQLEQSNNKIIDAYYEIANFYKDELKDTREAIKTYEELLDRFPVNPYQLAVHYNLYRLYADIDPTVSEEHKNYLIKNYPESAFAKIIINPDYNLTTDTTTNALNKAYNEAYDLYSEKDYLKATQKIRAIEATFGPNTLSAQLAYLNALSVGHTQNLNSFELLLKNIVTDFPADSLVTPLVKEQLRFIELNREKLNTGSVALIDSDPDFDLADESAEPVVNAVVTNPTPKTASKNEESAQQESQETNKEPEAVKNSYPTEFSLPDSASYYYVINITEPGINLSSSRFGIGQFNRSNYTGAGIKHQLKEVNNENQLIFVGVFESREAATSYEKKINAALPAIMKIPGNKYNTFVITKEGLDKLKDRKIIDSYSEFYKNNN